MAKECTVIIEIPLNTRIKYEIDKGQLSVDRILSTAMVYPGNYGFIPRTCAGDGDPVDVLVVNKDALYPGAKINCRILGALMTTDEAGEDWKIIAVPSPKVDPCYAKIETLSDLPEGQLDLIEHFFSHYKDQEKGKTVHVKGWVTQDIANQKIDECRDK